MKISCPYCGQHYEVDDSSVGMSAKCDKCQKDFTISVAPTESPNLQAVPSPPPPTTAYCRFCGGEIVAGAKKCRHCGAWLDAPQPLLVSKIFFEFCAWALMVVAIVSSIAREAFGFPEIFFELAAIFILLDRPRGRHHAQ